LCNIEKICTFLLKHESDPLEALVRLSSKQWKGRGKGATRGCAAKKKILKEGSVQPLLPGACVPVNAKRELALLTSAQNPERSWLYQTCTEVGFYQVCQSGSTCPFVQGLHTLDEDLKLCALAFGIGPLEITKQVRDHTEHAHLKGFHQMVADLRAVMCFQVFLTNDYYGSDKPAGRRILFPNGEIE